VHDLAAGEAGGLERIKQPGAGRIAAVMPGELGRLLITRKERDQVDPFVPGRQEGVGFQDQLACRHAPDPLKTDQWIAHVIEDTGAEDQIEAPDALWAQLVDIQPAEFNLALEVVAGEEKAVEAAMIPRVGVDGEDIRAATLEFEREVTVPRADIENLLALE